MLQACFIEVCWKNCSYHPIVPFASLVFKHTNEFYSCWKVQTFQRTVSKDFENWLLVGRIWTYVSTRERMWSGLPLYNSLASWQLSNQQMNCGWPPGTDCFRFAKVKVTWSMWEGRLKRERTIWQKRRQQVSQIAGTLCLSTFVILTDPLSFFWTAIRQAISKALVAYYQKCKLFWLLY